MYSLRFRAKALKQWNSLGASIRRELVTALEQRLLNPFVPSARLAGQLSGCYKIKLRKAGVRLVYFPDGERLIVTVVAVGKRDRDLVYLAAARELRN
jgi:mRNA interferase RelE/StbE